MMRKHLLYILFVFYSFTTIAQVSNKFEINTDGGTIYIPVYERQGLPYVSVKHLADALRINYYVNEQTGKVELKFDDTNLKITPKNPFIVIDYKSEGRKEVKQLPTSTYQFDGIVFIPLDYALPLIEKLSGKTLPRTGKFKIAFNDKLQVPVDDPKTPEEKITSSVFDVTGVTIDQKANGTLIKINSGTKIPVFSSSYNSGIISVVLRNVKVDVEAIKKNAPIGLIKEIDAKNSDTYAEIKFTVSNEYSSSEIMKADGNNLLLTIHNKVFVRSENKNSHKEKWDMDVIVIDAGHGGKDGGALGVNGTKEKDVNLAVALKLGELIKKNMQDVKVVYTRSGDYFVELYKRGKIANEKNGKLFISIHCNSAKKKPSEANGFEVYLLRPGRTKEAIAIAEVENSVIEYEDNPGRYQQLTDENFILVSMAHSSYMKYSEKFSELLNNHFGKKLSLASRGVKQAGFYVLVGASMPSVLIETGLLSNNSDAKYLASKKGQNEIAESIFNAVKDYKLHYEKMMESEL